MKRAVKKLQLRSDTLRTLTDRNLTRVAGGETGITATCSFVCNDSVNCTVQCGDGGGSYWCSGNNSGCIHTF